MAAAKPLSNRLRLALSSTAVNQYLSVSSTPTEYTNGWPNHLAVLGLRGAALVAVNNLLAERTPGLEGRPRQANSAN